MTKRLTLEESEDKVNHLKEAIETAKAKRDYDRAAVLQSFLKKEMETYNKLLQRHSQTNLSQKMAKCEEEREEEQNKVSDSVNERLSQIKEYYTQRYEELEQAHHDNLERIQEKFSTSTWTSIRISPTIRALQRAEEFYANNEDFKAAGQIRRQIQAQTRKEVEEFELNTRATIEAKIRDAVNVYQSQQRTFAQRLLNDKNCLKRDAGREILAIDNKYKKRYHMMTGKSEQSFELTAPFKNKLFARIDRDIEEFARQIQAMYKVPGEVPEEVESARESRGVVSSPRNKPIPGRTAPVTREPTTPRASMGRSATVKKPRTNRPRNPRVQVALARANRSIDLAETVNVV